LINDVPPLSYLNYKIPRAYVKPIGEEVFYRIGWSLMPNKPVKEALETIRNDVRIDKESLIAYFSV
jgi:hypothetical protein